MFPAGTFLQEDLAEIGAGSIDNALHGRIEASDYRYETGAVTDRLSCAGLVGTAKDLTLAPECRDACSFPMQELHHQEIFDSLYYIYFSSTEVPVARDRKEYRSWKVMAPIMNPSTWLRRSNWKFTNHHCLEDSLLRMAI